jgi:hypothetical protein
LGAAAVMDADTSRNAVVSGKYPPELQAILRELAHRFSQLLRYRFPVGTSSGRRRMAGNCVIVLNAIDEAPLRDSARSALLVGRPIYVDLIELRPYCDARRKDNRNFLT